MENKKSKENFVAANKKEFAHSFFWLALVIFLLVLVARIFDLGEIQNYIASLGPYGPLIFIVAKASTIVFAPLAGAPIYLLAGPLFGFYEGFVYVLIGDIVGSTIAFYLSRMYGRKLINLFFPNNGGKTFNKILSYLGNWKGIVYARIVFFTFQDLISYAAGLTKISYISFISASIVAGVIPIALLVAFGLALVDKSTIIYTIIIAILVVLCLLVLENIIKASKRKNRQ